MTTPTEPARGDGVAGVPLLDVSDLTIGIPRRGSQPDLLVRDVTFDVSSGERYGLVGESGSGKSMTLKAIAGLLPGTIRATSGSIAFQGRDLLALSARERQALMGPEISMIFQEPMTALNPTMRVGRQIAEGPRRHLGLSRTDGERLAVEMLTRTGVPDPERRSHAYPHELSGGLRQRVMIAIALSCNPRLVLCDEPTTALDVTVQDQVLWLLATLCRDSGSALVFVTHDLAVINQTCDRLSVMYSGRIMETGPVSSVYDRPLHPYTEALLASAPDFDVPDREIAPIPGLPPSLVSPPPGCPFAPRCTHAVPACTSGTKHLAPSGPGRWSACDRVAQIYGGRT